MSLNVLRNMKSRVISRYSGSHGCFQSLNLSSAGKSPKFIDPTFSDAISGPVDIAALILSSRVMPRPPPVEMFMTERQPCLILGRNFMKVSGLGSGCQSADSARADE